MTRLDDAITRLLGANLIHENGEMVIESDGGVGHPMYAVRWSDIETLLDAVEAEKAANTMRTALEKIATSGRYTTGEGHQDCIEIARAALETGNPMINASIARRKGGLAPHEGGITDPTHPGEQGAG